MLYDFTTRMFASRARSHHQTVKEPSSNWQGTIVKLTSSNHQTDKVPSSNWQAAIIKLTKFHHQTGKQPSSNWQSSIIQLTRSHIISIAFLTCHCFSFRLMVQFNGKCNCIYEQYKIYTKCCFSFGPTAPHWTMASPFRRLLDHTQRRTTAGRTPLEKWSARCRDLYLTTHNTHNKHSCAWWDSNPQSQQPSGRRPTP
jgi:hypothetical protein